MKKIAVLVLGGMLAFNFAAFAAPKEADQKWLQAVEKMVVGGQQKVSTPSEDRMNLLKSWGAEKGYAVKVTKSQTGYTLEVTKSLAQK